ncbi:hypothetical protein Taro_043802 [Colocasia esculenta]|uniref:Uncharacterized protein n=1 Tax=Colocasia esculenta TaxID=4460 RepID=A0A843X280_COLES|nr:hypothetical protein [Colocasia esculenta]
MSPTGCAPKAKADVPCDFQTLPLLVCLSRIGEGVAFPRCGVNVSLRAWFGAGSCRLRLDAFAGLALPPLCGDGGTGDGVYRENSILDLARLGALRPVASLEGVGDDRPRFCALTALVLPPLCGDGNVEDCIHQEHSTLGLAGLDAPSSSILWCCCRLLCQVGHTDCRWRSSYQTLRRASLYKQTNLNRPGSVCIGLDQSGIGRSLLDPADPTRFWSIQLEVCRFRDFPPIVGSIAADPIQDRPILGRSWRFCLPWLVDAVPSSPTLR